VTVSGYDDFDKASARADLCRFLAACYYEPDPEFAEERLFDSMLEVAGRIDPELAELARKLGEDFAAQDLQSLLIDYTKLFLGPMQPLVSPLASVWLSGEATSTQDSTMVALDLYDQAGFELDEEFREVPDHVAVELEFLCLLTFRQSEAHRADLADIVRDWEQLERFFLAKHLGAWIGPFAAAVKAGAETAFYRDLAELTERFVRMEEANSAAQ
jgi:putative dimethyl sulfoxide reductase chaperone